MNQIEEKIMQGKLDTLNHIDKVRNNILIFVLDLMKRASEHDASKLQSPEAEVFGEFSGELSKVEYGSKEYSELLEKVKPAIEHHYANNRHHTEYHKNGIDDMTLIDLIEMLSDWKAATERNKNGNIRKSIEHNKVKYKMSDQLARIFENTVKEYF